MPLLLQGDPRQVTEYELFYRNTALHSICSIIVLSIIPGDKVVHMNDKLRTSCILRMHIFQCMHINTTNKFFLICLNTKQRKDNRNGINI